MMFPIFVAPIVETNLGEGDRFAHSTCLLAPVSERPATRSNRFYVAHQ
jgi:hypothetical protein